MSLPLLLQSPPPVAVSWNAVAVPGAFEGHPAGPFELNEKLFSTIIKNFKRDPLGRINVDLDHRSETLEGGALDAAFAPAWITDLRIDAGKLYGKFEWTDPKTVEMVRSGQLMYLSPSIAFNYTDPVTGESCGARLSSVALTNKPFLREIPVVNATARMSLPISDEHLPGSAGVKTKKDDPMADKEEPKDDGPANAFMKRMRSKFKLSETAGFDDLEAAMSELMKNHEMSEARESKRLSEEADALVTLRVDAGIVPNTPEAIASAKTLCLSNRETFVSLFPEPKKPAKPSGGVLRSDEAALLSGRVLGKPSEQPTSVTGEQKSYRVQLMTLSNQIAAKLRETDPSLDEYSIEMKASSEAKQQLAAQAVERIGR